jgi:excisionase family DNA binding protein
MSKKEIPIWEKACLTLEEASAYSGIGQNKLREITNKRDCRCVLFVGNKRLIKRKELDEYISKEESI